jgi:hypothetical protein
VRNVQTSPVANKTSKEATQEEHSGKRMPRETTLRDDYDVSCRNGSDVNIRKATHLLMVVYEKVLTSHRVRLPNRKVTHSTDLNTRSNAGQSLDGEFDFKHQVTKVDAVQTFDRTSQDVQPAL